MYCPWWLFTMWYSFLCTRALCIESGVLGCKSSLPINIPGLLKNQYIKDYKVGICRGEGRQSTVRGSTVNSEVINDQQWGNRWSTLLTVDPGGCPHIQISNTLVGYCWRVVKPFIAVLVLYSSSGAVVLWGVPYIGWARTCMGLAMAGACAKHWPCYWSPDIPLTDKKTVKKVYTLTLH